MGNSEVGRPPEGGGVIGRSPLPCSKGPELATNFEGVRRGRDKDSDIDTGVANADRSVSLFMRRDSSTVNDQLVVPSLLSLLMLMTLSSFSS